jgi:hypothetical protein
MFGDSWSVAEAAGQSYAMSDAVRRYSFLNRWYIFKRRSDRRPVLPAAVPAPPVGLTEVRPEAASEAVAGGAAAPPQLDIIELSEEVGVGAGVAAAAAAPAPEPIAALPPPGPYIVNMPGFSLDERLGAALADWKNYMALGTPVEITDLADPSIKYPSVEAAIAAAKYQRTTDKPALGASLFRVEGAIYQKYLPEITAAERWSAAYYRAIDRLVVAIRTAATPKKMETYRAIPKKEDWNKAAWDAQKADVYQGYLMQRFRVDERFREMVQAIQRAGGEILFANGTEPTELGVGIRMDGSVAGGENKIGKWIQELH